MRVLHICVCGPFTDGLSYQENELIEQHVALGHEVTVIAAPITYDDEKLITHVEVGTTQLNCGATLIRLPYSWGLKGWLATKIRAHGRLRKCLEQIKPDRILFHGLSAWSLLTVSKFVRQNPRVKLFADCHEDFNNSAMTWASRNLLHRLFYRPIFRWCTRFINEVLCVTVESLDFALDFYKSPKEKSRLYPLGCVMDSKEDIARRRNIFRDSYEFSAADVVIVQTGKLDNTKRLHSALLAFVGMSEPWLKFVIAGKMSDEVNAQCMPLINSDTRIINLGWQTTDQLRTVLSGCDIFLQPFGQTVTTQMAMGYGCVIFAQDLPSHRWLVGDYGRLFKDANELDIAFKWLVENRESLKAMQKATLKFATAQLDYKQLALQIVS